MSDQAAPIFPSHHSPHGLATVAMLKANFDVGRDHISMFEPFVRDAVATHPADDMDLTEVSRVVAKRHELVLPVNTMRTLLGRIVKQGYLRREAGRYLRTDKDLRADDVLQSRLRAEERQRRLADGLIASAAERRVTIDSTEDALALIMSFMESYHVNLAFDEPPTVDGAQFEDSVVSPQHVATALFLKDAIAAEGEFGEVLQEVLEGFVLQNTLLLKDISTAGRQFQNLEVIADSKILFGALGLRGPVAETATVELLELLKKTGASVSAFEPTIREMRRILMVYEEKIGTREGRETLHPSELTRYFFAEQFTPADVREQATLLELKLKEKGIPIRELPKRQAQWTLEEASLAKALADDSGRENEPRVVHDIDCVAGVLTYRRGKTSESLDSARAIFVTTSGMTVKHTRHWYRKQGGGGFPPIVHVQALSNFAWLKRPASAAKLKAHELVALCTAALRPSRRTWEHFVEHLRSLEASRQLSSDEVAALVVSGMTQNVLAEAGIDEESDAETMSEVIERVRAEYGEKAAAAVDAANREAEQSRAEADDLRIQIRRRAHTVARAAALLVTITLAVCAIAGTGISLVETARGETPSVLALVFAVGPLAILGLLGIMVDFHLKALQEKTEARVAATLERWMLHGRFCPPESEHGA